MLEQALKNMILCIQPQNDSVHGCISKIYEQIDRYFVWPPHKPGDSINLPRPRLGGAIL